MNEMPASSQYYERTREQAMKALAAFPQGMQIGGGITADTAAQFLEAGASHVIVTSYIFRGGQVCWEHMERLKREIGREHIVMDLSCRRRDGQYYIVTDRWQTFTDVELSREVLMQLSGYCDEFLIYSVDVEGKSAGMDEAVAVILGNFTGCPLTYAGGIASLEDIVRFQKLTKGRVDFTVGSALDIFGGHLSYEAVRIMSADHGDATERISG